MYYYRANPREVRPGQPCGPPFIDFQTSAHAKASLVAAGTELSFTRKCRKYLIAGAWLSLILGTALAATEKKMEPDPFASPGLKKVVERLGEIGFDGGWRKSFSLDTSLDAVALGLKCTLRHKVEMTVDGAPRSVWQIDALRTSLTPEGREHLRWIPPGGHLAVNFEIALIGPALNHAGTKRWLIRKRPGGDYEILATEGQRWIYRRGSLIGIDHPQLGRFVVKSRGGLIKSVRRADFDGGKALLEADYDDDGKVLELTFSQQGKNEFVWSTQGELVAWKRSDGRSVKYFYCAGLLSRIIAEDGSSQQLTWRENPGWRRGDRNWPAPWHLASDGVREYDYGCSNKGFLICVRQGSSAKIVKTWINPKLMLIEQRADSNTLSISFLTTGVGFGRIEKVDDGRGDSLELYRYDADGNLTSIVRKGEPTRSISYDRSGRLMGLAEVQIP